VLCSIPVGALALVGASAARGRVAAPAFQLEIAFSCGLERWGRVVRFGWRLEQVDSSLLASILQVASLEFLINFQNAGRPGLASCPQLVLARRAQEFPHSSTLDCSNFVPVRRLRLKSCL